MKRMMLIIMAALISFSFVGAAMAIEQGNKRKGKYIYRKVYQSCNERGEVDTAHDRREDRQEDALDERRNDGGERTTHDKPDRHVDQVSLHCKLYEFHKHFSPSVSECAVSARPDYGAAFGRFVKSL